MTDWLPATFHSDAEISPGQAAIRLGTALLLGLAVATIYALTRGRSSDRSFAATLVLLSVLLALTTLVIGDNVARAFSIVGALSIVRFRTVVEDTRDTAFVIFAVAVGMAVGAGFLLVPLIALPFVAIAATALGGSSLESRSATRGLFALKIRVGVGFTQGDALRAAMLESAGASALAGIATVRGGSAVERSYELEIRDEAAANVLVERLTAFEGVQSVELERRAR